MNTLAKFENAEALTMSSREIAELTSKRHDLVLRDVEKMIFTLGITDPKLGGCYQDGTEQEDSPDLGASIAAGMAKTARRSASLSARA